jgi:cell division cycle protein 37
MPIDYSKWKNIEISDDEDDTHPNIDTPSLFRWRHQARLERQAESDKEKADLEKAKRETEQKKKELNTKLKTVDAEAQKTALKIQEEELKQQEDEFKRKEEELLKKERLAPWNVDTISHDKFTKTIINNEPAKRSDAEMTEEERAERYKNFLDKSKTKIKHFGMLRNYEDSKRYLTENPDLVCEDTANYLVVWCIDLEIEDKHDLMEHVAHQCIIMQFILELSKTLKYDPRTCVGPFFTKMQKAEREYKEGFNDELNAFKNRITKRAKEKIDAAMKEAEEEERQARLGPGGLDPVEVFDSLPDELKRCFESQDIKLLQDTLLGMKKEEAEYLMDRCVKSGLWVPDAGKSKVTGDEAASVEATAVDTNKTIEGADTQEELYTDVENKSN